MKRGTMRGSLCETNECKPDCCDDDRTSEMGPIEARFLAVAKAFDCLDNAVAALRERLHGALRSEPTCDEDCKNGICMPVCSPVAQNLIAIEDRVRNVEKIIEDVLDRLEL